MGEGQMGLRSGGKLPRGSSRAPRLKRSGSGAAEIPLAETNTKNTLRDNFITGLET